MAKGDVSVRMYRQGLGDCFLVRLPRPQGDPFHLMIDCGVIVGTPDAARKMKAVVRDIIATTGGFVDVLVVTHEHWDHVSGFEQAGELFNLGHQSRRSDRLSVGEVWLPWTEDPANPLGRQLAKERQDRIKGLQAAGRALAAAMGASPRQQQHTQRTVGGIGEVLGFFGIEEADLFGAAPGGGKTGAAMQAARSLSRNPVRYWKPGEAPWFSNELPGVRIFPLGPPEDAAAIRRTDDRHETYHSFAAGPAAEAFFGASPLLGDGDEWNDPLQPFDTNVGCTRLDDLEKSAKEVEEAAEAARNPTHAFFARNYFALQAAELTHFTPRADFQRAVVNMLPSILGAGFAAVASRNIGEILRPLAADLSEVPALLDKYRAMLSATGRVETGTVRLDQAWRRIDADWLGLAPEFALQLDGATNNTSLVLAIELSEGGPVLLFVGDAQAGNWLSWDSLSWKVGRRTVSVPDLFARTVFYKCGHHGSHNATLKDKGVERMTGRDLVAFVPVDRPTARRKNWNRMPLPGIIEALAARTGGRVALSETDNDDFPRQDFKNFGKRLTVTDLYLEVSFASR